MPTDEEQINKKLDDILTRLIRIQEQKDKFQKSNSINELIEKIQDKKLRFFELAILGRKLLELLLSDLSNLNSDTPITVYEHINNLKSNNVADWMISYLHTLRIFGNFVAHNSSSNTIPNQMNKNDIIVFTYALDRFLEFYIVFNKNI